MNAPEWRIVRDVETARLGSVDDEIGRKAASLVKPPDATVTQEMRICSSVLGEEAALRVSAAMSYVRSLDARGTASEGAGYLAHVARVAGFVARLRHPPAARTIVIAVLHNVFEIYRVDEDDLARVGCEEGVGQAVRVLTTDRRRADDPRFLAEFRARIEAAGPDVSLVRCADKLDNLLGLGARPERGERVRYAERALLYELPLATRLSGSFGVLFEAVARRCIRGAAGS